MLAQKIQERNNRITYAMQAIKACEPTLSEQQLLIKTKERLLESAAEHDRNIISLSASLKENKEALLILNTVKDMNTAQSYEFIEHNLNLVLDKVFAGKVRKIRLAEGLLRNKYPELQLELTTENDVKRSLKTDSGHGMRQIVSLLCTLCLICVSGTRRFLVLDEVLTGLSPASKQAVDDILWAFADIGFQFIISEHGFIPHNAHVYELEYVDGSSRSNNDYIATHGFYAANKKKIVSTDNEDNLDDENLEEENKDLILYAREQLKTLYI